MNLLGKPPLGLKPDKAEMPKKPRKPIPRVSRKRAKQKASAEGKAATLHMMRVKILPCVICGKPGPSDAHHVFHGRYGTRKSNDLQVIPLCKAHHQEGPDAIHNGKETWAEKYGFDYDYLPVVADMLAGELTN